ncbi:hypothetical protein ABT366_37330, partial [Streptomyces lydicus]|uniref:Cgl0159 family (beta/alpha)8-fold protein n=1 Tax=Streptomyces lydicus TaxID=47763 RepID=UPI00335896F2
AVTRSVAIASGLGGTSAYTWLKLPVTDDPDAKARVSRQTAQGNAASGQATQAKKQAAQLWNPLAKKYGLTERRPEQL